MPPFSQPPRPPMPGQAPGVAPRPPMPGMPGAPMAGAPRPPMPGQAPMGGAPRPPMPGAPMGGAPRPPMPGQAPMANAPRPPMPQQGAQGGFGAPRPGMPQQGAQGGFGAPRPGMPQQGAQSGFGAPRPMGPQGGFGAGPQAPQAQGMFNGGSQQTNMDFGDNQYIKDLKTLEKFYEDNKFSEILAKRYEDFEIPDWEAPMITLPKDEIFSRLKYYDDIKKYERLDEKQLIQIQKKINQLIKQLNYIDDYEHYQEYGNDVLSYNDRYLDDNRTIHWYQREVDIRTDTGYASDIQVAIPKEKWWMLGLADATSAASGDVYVNSATIPGAENPLLSHPMFTNMRTIGSNSDLPQDRILVDYPDTTGRNIPKVNVGSEGENNSASKKKHFWNKKKDKGTSTGGKVMPQSNNAQQMSPGFPKKQNPQGPQAPSGGGFPQRQNPQAPSPNGGFGRPQGPQAPTPGGFGNKPPQQGQGFFGYQR